MSEELQRRLCSLIEQIQYKYNEINDIVQSSRSDSQQLTDKSGDCPNSRDEAASKGWEFGVYCERSL